MGCPGRRRGPCGPACAQSPGRLPGHPAPAQAAVLADCIEAVTFETSILGQSVALQPLLSYRSGRVQCKILSTMSYAFELVTETMMHSLYLPEGQRCVEDNLDADGIVQHISSPEELYTWAASIKDAASQSERVHLNLLTPLRDFEIVEACRSPSSQLTWNENGGGAGIGDHEWLNLDTLFRSWRAAWKMLPMASIREVTFDISLDFLCQLVM